ncbi:hypothetical protein BGX24_002711 [Mortierella sp. AD032]|nr:hypothetical protein BGX24_002711 [Mortierella sp. AD032]
MQPASHDINGTHNSTKFQLQYLCNCAGFKKSVLEMFRYRVNIDKVPREEAQRVSLVIEYLKSKGIQSCQGFVSMDSKSAVTESMLDQQLPIAVLDETTLTISDGCVANAG